MPGRLKSSDAHSAFASETEEEEAEPEKAQDDEATAPSTLTGDSSIKPTSPPASSNETRPPRPQSKKTHPA